MPPEIASTFEEWQRLMKVERYIDIPDPRLTSA